MREVYPGRFEYTRNEQGTAVAGIVFSLIWGIFLLKSPFMASVLIAPFAAWFVFKPRVELFLPLMITTFWGAQISYLISLCCLIYALINFERLQRKGLILAFFVYLTGLPFFVWFTYTRMAFEGVRGTEFSGAMSSLGSYLSLAPFFWAAISFRRLPEGFFRHLYKISLLFLLLYLFRSLPIVKNVYVFIRYSVWCVTMIPMSFVLNVYVLKRRLSGWTVIEVFCMVLMVAMFLKGGEGAITFTQIGTAGYACFLLVWGRRIRSCKWLMMPAFLLILSCFYVWGSAERKRNYDEEGRRESYEELKINSIGSFITRLRAKAYGDRAGVWAASVNSIKKHWRESPVFIPPEADVAELDVYQSGSGQEITTGVGIAAHNVFLNCFRSFGFWGGSSLFLTYLLLVGFGKYPRFIIRHSRDWYGGCCAICLTHAVVGGISGHYLTSLAFGFAEWGILGLCAACDYEDRWTMNRGRRW